MLAVLALAGCVDVGTPGTWVPIETIEGTLEPAMRAMPNVRTMTSPTGAVRVVTYNILNGGIDPVELARTITADPELAKADVILLQEAVGYPEEGELRTARMADALGMAWTYVPARVDGTGTLGNAILSRYPLMIVEKMDLPIATRKRQRIAIGADVQIGDRTLRVITTHLDTSLNIPDRIQQLRPAIIDAPDAVLVGGDFNTSPYSWEDGVVPLISTSQVVDTDQAIVFDDYMGALGFSNFTRDAGPTARKLGIEARLDALFTRGMTVTAGSVERDVDVSDHWPVWVDVTLP